MHRQPLTRRDPYYTKDHEWIDFQGSVAYVGICRFKLTGFKQIQEIRFDKSFGFKKKGEVIASVKYNDYIVEVHMPVDGKLMQVNQLVSDNPGILLEYAEGSAWIAFVVPSQPHDRRDLLLPGQYQMNGKFAK